MARPTMQFRAVWGGAVTDPLGSIFLTLACEGSVMRFKKGSWFTRNDFEEMRHQITFVAAPHRKELPIYISEAITTPANECAPLENLIGAKVIDDTDNYDWDIVPLSNIGPFEVVNAHQWLSVSPLQLKDANGTVYAEEPALWDVAAVDQGSGGRILGMRSHNHKDQLFQFCNILNMWLKWLRDAAMPFQELVAEENPDDMPHLWDEDTDQERIDRLHSEIYAPMFNRLRDTLPPVFDGQYVVDEMTEEAHDDDDANGFHPLTLTRRRPDDDEG